MRTAFTAIISGRVHMVLFRDTTLRRATALGVVGEVRNLPDGTVRVIAEGERDKLDELVAFLHRGPFLARVDHVDVEWHEPTGVYDRFFVKYP